MDGAWYDYATAGDMWHAGRYNYVAFLCQQAVEKMLKAAVMSYKRRLYPKGHNLLELIQEAGLSLPENLLTTALRLSPHYLVSRYLNAAGGRYWELYNESIASELLAQTRGLLEWLKGKIESRP